MTEKTYLSASPREVLKLELERRCNENSRYSLRAFSRFLGVSHSALSLFLSGKRGMSKKVAYRVAERLDLDPAVRAQWFQLVSFQQTSSSAESSVEFLKLGLDHFQLISDWFYLAILSALNLPGRTKNARWLSSRLGIPLTQAQLAIERLQRLGLIELRRGVWKQTSKPIRFENGVSTELTRRYHQQLLKKAADSLERHSMELRDFSCMTFSMDPKLIPYARERIREFRRGLMKDLESQGPARAVYQMNVQIFPLTEEK